MPFAAWAAGRSVPTALANAGLGVEPVANTAKDKILVERVEAGSPEQAKESALAQVRELIPPAGYNISDAEPEALKS